MPKLPNFQNAVIEIEKLHDYCLNPEHPAGKNKARVFQSVLGITRDDSEELKEQILQGIRKTAAIERGNDNYGKRYTVQATIRNLDKEAEVITGWIIKHGEDFPRFITCYIKI